MNTKRQQDGDAVQRELVETPLVPHSEQIIDNHNLAGGKIVAQEPPLPPAQDRGAPAADRMRGDQDLDPAGIDHDAGYSIDQTRAWENAEDGEEQTFNTSDPV